MMTETQVRTRTQIHRVYIKASAQAIWDAITQPEWLEQYGYRCRGEYDLRPGGSYRVLASPDMKSYGLPDVLIVGEVIESKPPHKLVQTWHPVGDATMAAEPETRLTNEIVEEEGGICRLTVIHESPGAPLAEASIAGELPGAGGGLAFILSDLKTLLETGKPLGRMP
jgi:uncharacterized protein YndB with AHSA1/START domain